MVIITAVLEHGCQLQHTLQTWQGMVLAGGRAKSRLDEMPESFFKEGAASILADAAHLLKVASGFESFKELKRDRVFLQNMWSCTGGQGPVTERILLDYIRNAKRLDVEQAVAMVLAFVPKEVGEALAPHVAEMFLSANMWREGEDFEVEDGNTLATARGRKMARLRDAVAPMAATERASGEYFDEKLLVGFLMRVRRERSAYMTGKQRLQFPKYLIALVPEKERDAWTESYKTGHQTPVEIEEDRIVRVSKRAFARIQRWLLTLDGDQSEKSAYIREVAELEKEILYGHVRLDALEKTTDRAALAYSFMAVQRRLQLTVVSDIGWTEFLQKGQGRGVLQNRPDIVTSFEEELARHATDVQALVAIRPPKAVDHSTVVDELIPQVDRVCTLMEQYVLLFGDGLFENLRFSRIRKDGWKGRGPESTYNLLVDLLATLRERGKGHFTIGPCYKFLAKDIMAWNNAWLDDAFAPDKVPGWVEWLQARQKLRIQLPESMHAKPIIVEDSEDSKEDTTMKVQY